MRRSIVHWLRTVAALLAAATLASCADAPLLTPPPSAPLMSAVDVIESDGYTTITFDRDVPLPGWAIVGQTYARYGLEFFSGSVQSPSGPGAFVNPWEWDTYQRYLNRFPPSSLPGFVEFGMGSAVALRLYLSFGVPVSEVRLFVRPQRDFEIACYNAEGKQVGRAVAPGVFDVNRVPRVFPIPSPYPGYTLDVTGSGIRYCDIIARGGMMDDLRFRREKQDEVVLECTAPGESAGAEDAVARATQSAPAAITIERGKEIDCTAKAEGAGGGAAQGELQVARWVFEGVPRDDEAPTAPTWGGVMVRGGTVSVVARAGSGPERTASVNVTIRDRTWDETPVFHISEVPNGTDPEIVLPDRVNWAHDLGGTRFSDRPFRSEQRPDPTGYVASGPNTGLTFFADLRFTTHAFYVLNRAAMQQGSPFYEAQPRGTGGTVVGGVAYCPPRVVRNLVPVVEAHERKHVAAFQRAYAEVIQPEIKRLEMMAHESGSELAAAYDAVLVRAQGEGFRASRAVDGTSRNPVRYTVADENGPCVLMNEYGRELANEQ